VGKIAKKQFFVNSALKIQCHVVKNNLLQTAFSAIFPVWVSTYILTNASCFVFVPMITWSTWCCPLYFC